ncbi:MAG: RAMP superfamily CRISPR-associated protein, partial [Candidatus Thorarchaeota archaeon]
MEDSGGVRRIVSRWIVTGICKLTTATLLGRKAGHEILDAVVLRDKLTGKPLLTGASLAGAMRSYLVDVRSGYRTRETGEVADIFGSQQPAKNGFQSPLIVYDSVGEIPESQSLELRNGVALDPARGVAEEHKKFEYEVMPPGTEFPLRFELLVPDKKSEQRLVSSLHVVLSGLENGEIRIGGRRTRGMGECKVSKWRVRRFDLTTADGWKEWLGTDDKESTNNSIKYDSIYDALINACPSLELESRDARRRVMFELDLKIPHSVLIRFPGRNLDAPDALHLTSGGKSILSGTSLAGALRSRCLRIVNTICQSLGNQSLVDQLFGSCPNGKRKGGTGLSSRLIVSESIIDGGTRLRPARIGIDRFTGGTMTGALFEEEPQFGGSATVRLELRESKEGEVGLILLALRDLVTG